MAAARLEAKLRTASAALSQSALERAEDLTQPACGSRHSAGSFGGDAGCVFQASDGAGAQAIEDGDRFAGDRNASGEECYFSGG
jgi:hypothetical protein